VNRPRSQERRRRLIRRALPLAAVALIAFIAGVSAGAESPEKDAAERFVAAWAEQDFAAMHAELSPAARNATSVTDFADAYLRAQEVSTARALDPGSPEEREGGDLIEYPIEVATRAFGRIDGTLRIPFEDGGIAWDESLVFPGLSPDERLEARIELGGRAPILARDGTPLAEGPPEARSSPLGSSAIDVAGEVGQPEAEDADAAAEQGFPPGTPVGVSGVEQAFNSRLAGKPGGELVAVAESGGEPRVLASAQPGNGQAVRTTIDPDLQVAAVAALAGRSGGVAVLDTRTGAVRALAGTAFSGPQPPGSTFKIITTAAALEDEKVTLDEEFPVVQGANAGGRFIYNAHQEFCGGDFRESFAHSCNSVFAPLGVEVGEEALVEMAERFGWNSEPSLYNAEGLEAIDPPESTIPRDPGTDVDLAVSAIGQGQVLATPLQMASASQVVANDGVRLTTPLVVKPELGPDGEPVRVMSTKIASQLTDLMIGVVNEGTGLAGAIPEAQVAGKTGTAELGPKPGQENLPPGVLPEQIVDAWFTAFAPAEKPRLAVGVMLIDADADGGTVAAPVAAEVLSAGL
jgi:penicillin-binding protein A